MNVFAKIFSQIFDSSISADHVVRHIFMDLLVLADRYGVVDMTVDAISRRTNVPEEMVAHAIDELCKPDRKSRSHEEGGCRLIPIDSHRDWGWQIVNYEHYRNIRDEEARRTYFRDKKREQRSKTPPTPATGPTVSNLVKDRPAESNEVTQGEGNVEVDLNVDIKPFKRPTKKSAPNGFVDPTMFASAILTECRIGGRELRGVLEEIGRAEYEHGEDLSVLAERACASWEDYVAAKPTLEYSCGAAKFFGEGLWKHPESWPRIGAKPTAKDLAWKAFEERNREDEA